jgi:uncharacterized membrane protein YtjA (UPF0391 family)
VLISIEGENYMPSWGLLFLVIALIAAVFGFAGIAASAAGLAKIFFFLFLLLAAATLLFGQRATP